MDWLSENWLWILIGVVFIAMHLFGHGGHGGHGRHGGSERDIGPSRHDPAKRPGANAPTAHRHEGKAHRQ